MANPEHLQILQQIPQQGVEAWNAWRNQHEDIRPDLSFADLRGVNLDSADLRGAHLDGTDLRGVNLSGAHLRGASLTHTRLDRADLRGADLTSADLRGADLTSADLRGAHLDRADLSIAHLDAADLSFADLHGANLSFADLTHAHLYRTGLRGANLTNTGLRGANVSEVYLLDTVFGDTNLTDVRGLETCRHDGPSILDHRTLARSGPLPLAFLRGCGLPDTLIDYLLSLLGEPFQFYSCFISHASKDRAFAERLYADLQNKGVRCWFAPDNMKIGDRLRLRIDETIRVYDKLLLVLSESSVASQWVEQEVETALGREREQGTTVLFPVRIDDMVMTRQTGWPALIHHTRNIGDFRGWETHAVYQKAFDRLLRDLTAAAQKPDASA
jgi:hypothetical protein